MSKAGALLTTRAESSVNAMLTEAVVITGMALTTLAAGTALYLQGGIDVMGATLIALGCYAVMLLLHAFIRQSGKPKSAKSSYRTARNGEMPRTAVAAYETLSDDAPVRDEKLPDASSDPLGNVRPKSQPAFASFENPDEVITEPIMSLSKMREMDESKDSAAVDRSAPTLPPRESDVEMIQSLIKKLADEVNTTEAEAAAATAAAGKSVGTQEAISNSIGALRATAGSMRAREDAVEPASGSAVVPPVPVSPDVPEPPPVANQRCETNAISDALEAGRVDILLDPILGINDGKARHFEVCVRLRRDDNTVLDFEAIGSGLERRGVLPLLDTTRLQRTSQLAMRLQARGRDGRLFSQFAGESLVADKFLEEFADAFRARETFAGQLVMTFAQSDVRGFGEREWATLADMADLGFSFAMSGVSDLDMDFEDLHEKGFKFVKLDAQVFLEGLPAAEILVPASDICKHLAGLGFTVIVGGIENQDIAVRVFGFGALYGQGALFGAPRQVKPEALSEGEHGHVAA